MKNITVTFRCSCGYMERAEVPLLSWAGEYVNDLIQYGKIFHLAKQHAIENHNKKLDFNLLQFVKLQKEQKQDYKRHLAVVKNEQNEAEIRYKTEEDTKKLIELLQKAQEQNRIREEWDNLKKNA